MFWYNDCTLFKSRKKTQLRSTFRNILKYNPISIESLIGTSQTHQKNGWSGFKWDVKLCSWRCWFNISTLFKLKEQIESFDLGFLFEKVEMPLLRVLHDMEKEG